jgi:FOG: CheY-like receiver
MHIKGARLLVVEDDPILGSLWVDILGDAGAIVAGPCATVVDALEKIEKHQPVVALLDIQLLDGPSFPVARALAKAGIPFLFLSGDHPDHLPSEFAGSPYLCKPVAVRDLMHTLEHV